MARKPKVRLYGSGSVWRRGKGWAIRWVEGSRRRYRGGFASREEAQAVLERITADVRAGRPTIVDESSAPDLATLAKDWLERRQRTHRAWADDQSRWTNHLEPHFGAFKPSQVDQAALRRFVEVKLAAGLNPATVGHCVRLLSTLFSDLVERRDETGASANPVRSLSRATRRLFKPTHDPRQTPFIESLGEVEAVRSRLAAFSPQTATMFAVGAYAGLRPGEIRGLHWEAVDLTGRRIKVHQQVGRGQVLGPLKDDESRIVPILDPLLPILMAWKESTGGKGLMFTPGKGGGTKATRPRYVREHTLLAHLEVATLAKTPEEARKMKPGKRGKARPKAARKAPRKTAGKSATKGAKTGQGGGTERPTWYQATRHTFASHWVLRGGSMEKLAAILGHSSTEVTRRYAHLRPDLWIPGELGIFGGTNGITSGTTEPHQVNETTNIHHCFP